MSIGSSVAPIRASHGHNWPMYGQGRCAQRLPTPLYSSNNSASYPTQLGYTRQELYSTAQLAPTDGTESTPPFHAEPPPATTVQIPTRRADHLQVHRVQEGLASTTPFPHTRTRGMQSTTDAAKETAHTTTPRRTCEGSWCPTGRRPNHTP